MTVRRITTVILGVFPQSSNKSFLSHLTLRLKQNVQLLSDTRPKKLKLFQTSRQILCETDKFVQCFYIYAVNMSKYLRVLNVSSKLMSAGLIAAIIAVFEFPPVLKKMKINYHNVYIFLNLKVNKLVGSGLYAICSSRY